MYEYGEIKDFCKMKNEIVDEVYDLVTNEGDFEDTLNKIFNHLEGYREKYILKKEERHLDKSK